MSRNDIWVCHLDLVPSAHVCVSHRIGFAASGAIVAVAMRIKLGYPILFAFIEPFRWHVLFDNLDGKIIAAV